MGSNQSTATVGSSVVNVHLQLVACTSTDVNSLVPCRYTAAMPQLTPEFDRVVIFGLQTSDAKDFDTMAYSRLVQIGQEIRICEDYCLSDIYILDLGK
jgi:hypothetical protein